MPGDPPIVCYCGKPLGRVYPLFYKARAILQKEYADLDPAQLATIPGIEVDLSAVGDALGITTDCCRIRLATWRELRHERFDYIESMERLPRD